MSPTLKTIGGVARFFITRHRRCTQLGPYAVITVEARPLIYETRAFWGEEGPQVEAFEVLRTVSRRGAETAHAQMCARVRSGVAAGTRGIPRRLPPAA